ncbi:unnamed protein product [Dibothriocephalus latus]|uniref:Uncharacterized protein n=1 Tax=Dibothriocephalus latus TaxID=60516 RepID=A0A3P6T4X5_DIBLA|nr:unnamed protein product [Dibothriocephalus latus]
MPRYSENTFIISAGEIPNKIRKFLFSKSGYEDTSEQGLSPAKFAIYATETTGEKAYCIFRLWKFTDFLAICASTKDNSVALNAGQRRSFVNQSTDTSDEARNANQTIAMTNEATDTFELIKQRIDSLQYRRQCLRKILQEVTDRKHRLFKREDFHQEKPALDRKQKELAERLENVQREMEQLQQNIQRRRSQAL